jgi:DNA-binding response OmpR family regulator
VWAVASAEAFYRQLAISPVDMVVLDIGLPGEDGIGVARHVQRLPDLAVIIVSGRGTMDDRLLGLRAGADRYLVKPVDLEELLANIDAIGRRQPPQQAAAASQPWRLRTSDWILVAPNLRQLPLTASEVALLQLLMAAHGKTVHKQDIARQLGTPHLPNHSERTSVLIARLRKKAAQTLEQELPLKTVHQIGYAFAAPAVIE